MVIDTINDLKNFDFNQANNITVQGYYTKGDGGGGHFFWDGGSSENVNGGTTIESNLSTAGRWKRISDQKGGINVKWFGIKENDVNYNVINYTIFNTIAEFASQAYEREIVFPSGVYYGRFVINSTNLNILVRGSGIDVTTLKYKYHSEINPSTGGIVNFSDGCRNCSLKDLTIDGNREDSVNLGYVPINDGYVCLEVRGQHINIEKVKVINSYNKQSTVLGNNICFRDCKFIKNSTNGNQDGIHLYGETNEIANVDIENCYFEGHSRTGIFIEQNVKNINIQSNTFTKCYRAVFQQGHSDFINIVSNRIIESDIAILCRLGLGTIVIQNNNFIDLVSCAFNLYGSNQNIRQLQLQEGQMRFIQNINGLEFEVLAKSIVFSNNLISFDKKSSVPENGSSVISLEAQVVLQNGLLGRGIINRLLVIGNTLSSIKDGIQNRFFISCSVGRDAQENPMGIIKDIIFNNNTIINSVMCGFNIPNNEVDKITIQNNYFEYLNGPLSLKPKLYLIISNNNFYNLIGDGVNVTCTYTIITDNIFSGSSFNKRLVINKTSVASTEDIYLIKGNRTENGEPVSQYYYDNSANVPNDKSPIQIFDVINMTTVSNTHYEYYLFLDNVAKMRVSSAPPQNFNDGEILVTQS